MECHYHRAVGRSTPVVTYFSVSVTLRWNDLQGDEKGRRHYRIARNAERGSASILRHLRTRLCIFTSCATLSQTMLANQQSFTRSYYQDHQLSCSRSIKIIHHPEQQLVTVSKKTCSRYEALAPRCPESVPYVHFLTRTFGTTLQ